MGNRYQPEFTRWSQLFHLYQPINIYKMADLFDPVTVDRYMGRYLPPSFTESDYMNFLHIQDFMSMLKYTRNLSRAILTPKMQKIFGLFDARIANPKLPLKWTFMCGHDTEIYPLMTLFNISSSRCLEELYRSNRTDALNCEPGPEFAASLIFELHREEDNTYSVMIRYNGKYVYLCEQRQTKCEYEEFKRRVTKDFIDVAEICGNAWLPRPKKHIERVHLKTSTQKERREWASSEKKEVG